MAALQPIPARDRPGRRRPAAKMAARRNAIIAVMVAAVVRRRIKKGYWVFCGFTLGGKVLGTLKYLCFIPDMSSELFRALTSAATRRDPLGRKKPLRHSTHLESPATTVAARQSTKKLRVMTAMTQ